MVDTANAGRWIDSYLLRYFLAVVEHGGFTRAAESLYLTQPSLSQAIRTLETRVGTVLFDRSTHPIALTPAGTRFASSARALLMEFEEARRAVESVRGLQSGRLDLATTSGFAVEPLVDLIRRFRNSHGNILVNILTADTDHRARELVRKGVAELALGCHGSDAGGLRATPLQPDEIVLAASPRLVEPGSGPLSPTSVTGMPLVLDLSDRGTDAVFRRLVEDSTLPHRVVNCAAPSVLWGLVSRGIGATLAPRSIVEQYHPHLVYFSLSPSVHRTPALFSGTAPLSAAASAFVDLVTLTNG